MSRPDNVSKVCSNPTCPHKGKPQPLTNFYARKARCKTCTKAKARNWSEITREKHAEKVARNIPVEMEGTTWLPVDPWKQWLRAFIADRSSIDQAACDLGIDERVLWRWLYELTDRVNLDSVDAALCHCFRTGELQEIYPHLFDEQPEPKPKRRGGRPRKTRPQLTLVEDREMAA